MKPSNRPISLFVALFASLVLIIVLLCAVFFPINGFDAPLHLQWLRQYSDLVAQGSVNIKWLAESYNGYGAPVFYLYPPLVYWSAGFISLFGIPEPTLLFQLLGLLFLIASGLTSYYFFSHIFSSRNASLWASILYSTFLYRFIDLYERNAISEHGSFVFIPIVLLSFWLLLQNDRSKKYKTISITAIGWAGLVLTNIPSSVLFLYLLIIFVLSSKLYNREFTDNLIVYTIGAVLGFCISAVYVLPASELFSELSATAISGFTFSNGARLTGSFALDVWNDYSNKTFYLSLASVFIFGVSLIYFFYKRSLEGNNHKLFIKFIFNAVVLSVLVQIPYLFSLLRLILPGFDLLQFSWRWDIWITIAFAFAIGVAIELNLRRISTAFILVSSVLTIAIVGYFYSSIITREAVTAQNILYRGMEYLPSRATATPETIIKEIVRKKHQPELELLRGQGRIIKVYRDPLETTFQTIAYSPIELQFKRFYFPTWHLRDDRGVEYLLRPDSIGRITAILPAGSRAYRLAIVKTNEEQIGEWLSIIGLATLSAIGVIIMLSRKRAAS